MADVSTDGSTRILSNSRENVCPFPGVAPKKKIDRGHLINWMNLLNFKNEPLLIRLRHRKHGNIIALPALPQPCTGDEVECRWLDGDVANDQRMQAYDLASVLLTDGQRLTHLEPALVSKCGRQITFRLPAECIESRSRAIKRFKCTGISVQLASNSSIYKGHLVDFNAFFFKVAVTTSALQSFDWVSNQVPLNVTLSSGDEVFFAGDCKVARHDAGEDRREYVLEPVRSHAPRFRAKEFRPERRELHPNPYLVFTHPVTGKNTNLKVVELSASGFAVDEDYELAVLLPGMIIPHVNIHLSSSTKFSCTAQVIHRNRSETGNLVRVGLAILGMDIQEHTELISILHQAKNPDTYVANQIDVDALWEFFFETGFIYPEKYAAIQENKEKYRDIYTRLYHGNPTIARHFIHMEHGRILGHFAILRLYEHTWCNHHHAALHNRHKSGLIVLDRVTDFINETHSLRSTNFRYSLGYYRADNKFPVKVFGGFAEKMNNPKSCTVETFGFLNFQAAVPCDDWDSDGRWELVKARREDLADLAGFYEKASGGGMTLAATDMLPESLDKNSLDGEYAKIGFRRELHRFAIKKNGELKAVAAVNVTDEGLNLSELNNLIKIYVLDGSGFTRKDFNLFLSLLLVKFNRERSPVMVYPLHYLEQAGIPQDKTYHLMTVNLQNWDDYMRHTREFLRKARMH